MKKAWVIALSLLFVCGVALAEVGIRDSRGLIMTATDIYPQAGFGASTIDGAVYLLNASTAAITGGTIAGSTINSSTVGATTPAAGTFTTLTATGVIADVALYSKASAAYPVHLVKVGADGTVYGSGTGTALVDTGIYSATVAGGSNSAKYLCIYLDGTIYGSTTACR